MSKTGPYARTTCGACQREVAYHITAAGQAYLWRHMDRRTGQWCSRRMQSPDPRPLIDVMADADADAVLANKQAVAERMAAMRCPVIVCDGRLTRTAGKLPHPHTMGIPNGESLKMVPHPEVGRFQLGCTGPVMHIFDKSTLLKLEPVLLRTVDPDAPSKGT